jgi:hypothetical protein
LKGARAEEISPEWLNSFSHSIYLPMDGLLNNDDFAFLSRQPGFDLSLHRKLRKERLKIFHQYLERMIIDFNRLHLAARLAVSQSTSDQSHLLSQLISLKVRFSMAVMRAEFRYHLCLCGLPSPSVKTLLLHFEELSTQFAAIRQAA